ncbi:MAG TPA: NAD-dependent epimerase/dehydratase family protein [Puia sp.]|nr:NAD-dependent epimerase/dehydratase family protein [Puia sp.]
MNMELNHPIRVIITGATGMVGEGVLHECLLDPKVAAVLVIGRKSCAVTHPKLRELLVADFSELPSTSPELSGYDACFFCAGVTSVGKKEDAYYRLTYILTLRFAETLSGINPGMIFCYVSGAGTDSSEKGRSMWARVKGKTENDLMKLPFRAVYNFRPGYMHPTKGLRYTNPYYKYIAWLYPVLRRIVPNGVSTLADLGRAMIRVAGSGYKKPIIEVKDIKILAAGT